jgi:hypothetical protein
MAGGGNRSRLRWNHITMGLVLAVFAVTMTGCGGSASTSKSSSSAQKGHGKSNQSSSEISSQGSTVSANAGSEATGGQLSCPPAYRLEERIPLSLSWHLEEAPPVGEPEAEADLYAHAYGFCSYDDGLDTGTTADFLLVLAGYPLAAAQQHFAIAQERERDCREPSNCEDHGGGGTANKMFEDPTSFVDLGIEQPYMSGEPYIGRFDGAAVSGGNVCEISPHYYGEAEATDQSEIEAVIEGIHELIREACGLPAEAEEGEAPEGTIEGVSSEAGTTDDEAGAEQTYMAYNIALNEGDWQTACELLSPQSLEQAKGSCSKEFEKLFGQYVGSNKQAKIEEEVRNSISIDIRDGLLFWDGREWLLNLEHSDEEAE